MTATFTSPFRPAVALYSGGAVDENVPWKYPVALNGRPYLLDLASNQMQRGFEPRVRESVDLGTVPGEASVSPEGMWRRSQATWWYGAGQRWADNADTIPGRFYDSAGVDVWSDGELTLLDLTGANVNSVTADGIVVASDGSRLYYSQGDEVRYYYSSGNTLITGLGSEPVTGFTTNGYHTWAAQGTDGIYRMSLAGDTGTQAITSTVDRIGFVRNRLLVSNTNNLYDATSLAYGSSAALPTALFTHANSQFRWVGFAGSGTHIYAAGYAGNRSLIYKITLTAEGTSLGAPSVALELPPGEVVTALGDFPGGFILIGTSSGPRLALSGANGDLTVGALINTGSPVRGFATDSSFVWFTWETNHPSGAPGLGRMDLRRFTAPLTPAYASDIYSSTVTDAMGPTVTSVAMFDGELWFGIEHESTETTLANQLSGISVAEGWLHTGSYTWGLPDPKVVAGVDVRTNPLAATGQVQLFASSDEGAFQACQGSALVGTTFLRFSPQQAMSYKTAFKIVLLSQTMAAPVVSRFNARAFASPARSQVIRVPLLLHHRISVDGADIDQDAQFELLNLRGLVSSPQIVQYQEGLESLSVLVEDVVWIPRHEYVAAGKWDGTAVVTMRTIEQV